MMRLAEFIKGHGDQILENWEDFARKLSDANLSKWILRDHATAIIDFILQRMDVSSPPVEQRLEAAAKGAESPLRQVAAAHVKLRIDSGFALAQIIAEYCALRACVVRLWRELDNEGFEAGAAEITRFADLVDENITAAVVQYKERESQYRDRFVGILAHDIRTPINVILSGATLLAQRENSEEQLKILALILSSAGRLTAMTSDILDFARGRLGSPMPITMTPANMGKIVSDMVDEIQAANPACRIRFEKTGDLSGSWDVERIKQVVSNLLLNAIQHGTGDEVQLRVKGDQNMVVLQVHNAGPAIAAELIATMFDPLVRGSETRRDSSGLGLGLFIVNEIVSGHKGTIAVTSSDSAGTTFVVRLPRGSSQVLGKSSPGPGV